MNTAGKDFFELTVAELATLNLVLTLLLANGLNSNQLNILGNFLCMLGQNILTIQAVIGALPAGTVYCVAADPAYETPPAEAAASASAPASIPGGHAADEIQRLRAEVAQLKALILKQNQG